jgi:hypothetical protein
MSLSQSGCPTLSRLCILKNLVCEATNVEKLSRNISRLVQPHNPLLQLKPDLFARAIYDVKFLPVSGKNYPETHSL